MSSHPSQRPLLDLERAANMNRASTNEENANPMESILKPCFKRVEGLGVASIVTLVAVIIGAIPKYTNTKLHPDALTIAVLISMFSQFSYGLLLTKYAICMSHLSQLSKFQYILHTLFVSFHGFNLISTGLLFVALSEFHILLFSSFLVPMMFVIGIIGYAGRELDDNVGQTSDEAFAKAIKSCSDVSIIITGVALSTLDAIVIARLANPLPSNNPHHYPPLDLSSTVLTFMSGVFSMVITALPTELLPSDIRSKLVVLVNYIKSTMIVLMVITVMIFGAKFLGGIVFLALLPEMSVVTLYKAVELLSKEMDSSDENNLNDEPEIPTSFADVGKSCLLLLSVIYVVHSSRETFDIYLGVSIFILISVGITSLSRMVITLKPPTTGEPGAVNVVNFIAFILPVMQLLAVCGVFVKMVVDFYHA